MKELNGQLQSLSHYQQVHCMTFNPQFENEAKEDNTSIDEHEKQESLWRYLLEMSSIFLGAFKLIGANGTP